MSNKTDLQTLNTDYAALIETLRGKAVGGGGETCTVTVINDSDYDIDFVIVTPTGVDMPYMLLHSEETFEVVKNSLFVVYKEGWNSVFYEGDLIGDVQSMIGFVTEDGLGVAVLFVEGDCTISGLN